LWNAGGIFYALTYVVMFAIPIFGLRGVTPGAPAWLLAVSWSGLLMTVLYVVLSVFPIIKVANSAAFTFKITLVIVAANVLGAFILFSAKRRSAGVVMAAEVGT
jgi:hypothetical protein